MKSISARNKGLITGATMIVMSVCIFLAKKSFENGLQYIVYTTYVAGILWTLFIFKKETDNTATFKQYFAEGFKCFIVVTLLMVLFTLVFILLHPELKEQMATLMKAAYSTRKDMTPLDIENSIASAKKFFLPGYLMGAVISYLSIGALISVIGGGFLNAQKTITDFVMDLSIVIPLFNEDESLPELCAWIEKVMLANNYSYEVILIDDGSTDTSWEVIEKLRSVNNNLKGIKFQRNYGKSAALNEGFKAAQGDVIITMDADMQDSPDEIPELRRMILEDGFDIVSGWKKKRYDNTFTKNIPSKLFNAAARKSSGIKLHDFNCGLKAYRKKVVKSIEVYGEMHRYIPVLAKWAGFRKIGEKVVEHRARKYGVTKFGWERFVNGFLDLFSISFVGKFGKKPMHFFGLWGSIVFFIGTCIWIYLGIAKFAFAQYKMTERPLFYVGIISILVGIQLFLAGFIGELIARNSAERNTYLIEEKKGLQ